MVPGKAHRERVVPQGRTVDGELSRGVVVYREPEATRFAAGGPETRYPSPAVTGTA